MRLALVRTVRWTVAAVGAIIYPVLAHYSVATSAAATFPDARSGWLGGPPTGPGNPFLELTQAGHCVYLASWTRRGCDTRNQGADDVVRRLTSYLAAGDILPLHDGNATRTVAGQPIILTVLPRVLAAAAAIGRKPITPRSALDSPAA